MDLLGGGEAGGIKAAGAEKLRVRRTEPRQGGLAVGVDIDARKARDKAGTDAGDRSERFERTRCRGHSQRFWTLCLAGVGVGVGLAFFSFGVVRGSVWFFFGMAPLRTPGLGLGAALSRSLRRRSRAVSIGSS